MHSLWQFQIRERMMHDHWRTTDCVMCIRRRASNQATIHQVAGEVVASGVVQARCIDLSKTATLDPAVQDVPVAADVRICLLYTSDAADDLLCVDLGGRR